MTESDFFKFYLPALEKALEIENTRKGFDVLGPSWFISDNTMRESLDLFEQSNFINHKYLFESVALYFDAVSHGFQEVNGLSLEQFKTNLNDLIDSYKKKFLIT